MSNILSGETGGHSNCLADYKKIREEAVDKWKGAGLLDGISGHVKENLAQLYESQASFLIPEIPSTITGSTGDFENVVFPIVRRVFTKMSDGQEIVAVVKNEEKKKKDE